MNATFPVVLPNVWLPSNPAIDVMDGGMRDNYGQESTLRFMKTFNDWITENTSGVLIIQIRDRGTEAWETYHASDNISSHVIKPFLILQYNWFKMMEFYQDDELIYYPDRKHKIYKINLQYTTSKEQNKAALSFHLSQSEKKDILNSVNSPGNMAGFQKIIKLFSK
jgi:hypothetical protein